MRAVAFMVVLSSCSWLTVTPPLAEPQSAGDCTTSYAAPAIDTTMMIAGALGTALAAVAFLTPTDPHGDSAAGALPLLIGVPSVATMVTFGLSSRYGYRNTGRCRERLGQDR